MPAGVRSGHPRLSGPLIDSGVVDAEGGDYPAFTAGRQPGGALQPPPIRDLPTGLAAHPQGVRSQRQSQVVCARGNTSYPAQVVRVADTGDKRVPHNTHPQISHHRLSMPKMVGAVDIVQRLERDDLTPCPLPVRGRVKSDVPLFR